MPKKSERVFFSAVCPHRTGSLAELLGIISAHGVNMTKIESRPVKNKPKDYRFFIEADGDIGCENTQKMLAAIGEQTIECKLLGAYSELGELFKKISVC